MSFEFRPAMRENVGLIIGLSGPSGSGKTYTGMRLAKGIAGDKPFAVIDTEAKRALHYADGFKFDHGDLRPPFRPETYSAALAAADAAGYPVILVDSASHEWAGDGGILDWHEAELDRMGGQDFAKREACKMAGWIKPKQAHKQFVNKLLQLRAHVILCFRAEPKVEMVRTGAKWEIRAKQSLTGLDGWMPVCEKNLPFELTASFLLLPDQPGVPRPIKLQEQHKALFPLDKPITEESGKRLAAWARGDRAQPAVEAPDVQVDRQELAEEQAHDWLTVIAEAGTIDDLNDVNRQLKAAASTMPAAALEKLRTAYAARRRVVNTQDRRSDARDTNQPAAD